MDNSELLTDDHRLITAMSRQNLGLKSSNTNNKEVSSPSVEPGHHSSSSKVEEKRPENEPSSLSDPAEAAKTAKPPALPNGGTQAWLQVVGAFVLFFNTWYDTVQSSKN